MEAQRLFLAVYDEHADQLYRFCVSRTSDTDVAHDLTQDTFMRFWDALRTKGYIAYPRALLYQIARNAIIDWYRKHTSDSLDTMQHAGFDPEDVQATGVLEHGEYQHILRTIGALPAEQQELLILRYVNDLKPREIAAILSLPVNTVSVRIHRALDALRNLLNPS